MKKITIKVFISAIVAISFAVISGFAAPGLNGMFDTQNDGLVVQKSSAPTNDEQSVTIQDIGIGGTLSLLVTEDVDLSFCGTGAIQCRNHTFMPVNSLNHNPIRIGILVTANGVGVRGLKAGNFTFSNPFVPAGGSSAGICGLTVCGPSYFADAGNGQYIILVHPVAAGSNWKAGHYFATLTVKRSTTTVSTLVSWEVPK